MKLKFDFKAEDDEIQGSRDGQNMIIFANFKDVSNISADLQVCAKPAKLKL